MAFKVKHNEIRTLHNKLKEKILKDPDEFITNLMQVLLGEVDTHLSTSQEIRLVSESDETIRQLIKEDELYYEIKVNIADLSKDEESDGFDSAIAVGDEGILIHAILQALLDDDWFYFGDRTPQMWRGPLEALSPQAENIKKIIKKKPRRQTKTTIVSDILQ